MTEEQQTLDKMKDTARMLLEEMKQANPQESFKSFNGELLEGKQVEFQVVVGEEIVTRPNKFNPEVLQAILPVVFEGERRSWWINVKNPIYRAVLEHLAEGRVNFAILKTGAGKETRYNITKAE